MQQELTQRVCQVKWEVVCVTLMHNFHAQTSAVEYVCPSVKDVSLVVLDRLVEVETVEVECHGAYAQCGEPDSNDKSMLPGRSEVNGSC